MSVWKLFIAWGLVVAAVVVYDKAHADGVIVESMPGATACTMIDFMGDISDSIVNNEDVDTAKCVNPVPGRRALLVSISTDASHYFLVDMAGDWWITPRSGWRVITTPRKNERKL